MEMKKMNDVKLETTADCEEFNRYIINQILSKEITAPAGETLLKLCKNQMELLAKLKNEQNNIEYFT